MAASTEAGTATIFRRSTLSPLLGWLRSPGALNAAPILASS